MIEVLISPDDRYVAGAVAVLRSAAGTLTSGQGLRAHIVADHLSAESVLGLRSRLTPVCETVFHVTPLPLPMTRRYQWFTPACLGRLQPDILPAEVSRVLYLDCDTVVQEDLTRLFDVDLKGHALAAVHNMVSPDRVIETGPPVRQVQFGAVAPGYFNSGVMLFDLDVWRRLRYTARIRDLWARFGEHLHGPDQDVLNLAFAGEWQPLSPVWNKMVGTGLGTATEDWFTSPNGILHYIGASKPWHRDFPPGPLREVYDAFTDTTRPPDAIPN